MDAPGDGAEVVDGIELVGDDVDDGVIGGSVRSSGRSAGVRLLR